MKKLQLLWLLAACIAGGILIQSGCSLIKEDEEEPGGYTQTIYSNPDDGVILELDSAGRKVIYMGEKDAQGLPVSITEAVVYGEDLTEESQTLISFDALGRATSLFSQANGMMTLEYVSDTQVVIVYTLPDTYESYQLTFNPENPKKLGDCGCPESGYGENKEYQKREMTQNASQGNPPEVYESYSRIGKPKSTSELEGKIYTFFNQTVNPVTGTKVHGSYVRENDAEQRKYGLKVTEGDQPGQFYYYFPSNPAPAPPPGFSDKAQSLLNGVCLGAIPVALAKHQICLRLVNPLVILKCEAVLTAYVWLCRANTGKNVGNFIYDSFTAENVDLSVVSLHPSLPTKSAEATAKPATGHLPDINIVYDAFAVIGSLYTSPSDPDPEEGYTIYCKVLNGIPGVDQLKISMYGTDGYSQEETYNLDAGMTCTMFIPGGAEGVTDEITAEVISADPQPGQTNTIFVIF